ncbi:ecto-ADP-ribosyltransferase 5-like [Microcaecilia unicolor]|uniref:NAD(P)(+)--arginine ADP-ribosyltransferase n=1 Tax=Microcaecilia unicolor TaxID=1415580 RepID=A0A6P7XJR6_9AMPH|nr:ecto-ADP-ribosyltransferase 5-like [Microcaecilia unicolor]
MVTVSISIISSSLYVLTLLGIPQVKCQITEIKLNMTPKAFDDQYLDCEEAMVKKMRSENLLEAEENKDPAFKKSWEDAVLNWTKKVQEKTLPPLPKGFTDEHGIALLAYTGHIYKKFNKAVRDGGESPEHYMENFHFKVLHFYLTTALKLLRGNCGERCQTVYRGNKDVYFLPPKSSDKKMRFGQFTSTSKSKEVAAKKFGKDSFFTLMTCFGVCIEEYSYYPNQKEVLLPVNEVFTVSSFDEQTHSFVLNSTQETCSRYNCAYLEGANATVGTTYKYCYSSAPRGGRLLFSMITPPLITGVFIIITAVTPGLVSGF